MNVTDIFYPGIWLFPFFFNLTFHKIIHGLQTAAICPTTPEPGSKRVSVQTQNSLYLTLVCPLLSPFPLSAIHHYDSIFLNVESPPR